MFLIAHSFRNGQIAISKRPKKKFERVRGTSNGVDLVLLFACLTYTSKLYQRVLFYISFHLKLTHAISRVSFTWNDLMTKKKKANFNCATEQNTRISFDSLGRIYVWRNEYRSNSFAFRYTNCDYRLFCAHWSEFNHILGLLSRCWTLRGACECLVYRSVWISATFVHSRTN